MNMRLRAEELEGLGYPLDGSSGGAGWSTGTVSGRYESEMPDSGGPSHLQMARRSCGRCCVDSYDANDLCEGVQGLIGVYLRDNWGAPGTRTIKHLLNSCR
jgi:hypothetical protein